MFKKLRLRLTVICTIITGAILIGMACASLYTSEQQLAQWGTASFTSDVNAILFHLRSQNVLDHTWLSQTETSGQVMIYLEDSGTPLLYAGPDTGFSLHEDAELLSQSEKSTLNTARTRVELLLEAKAVSRTTHHLDISQKPRSALNAESVYFPMWDASGQKYYAAAAAVPISGGWIGLTVAKSHQPEEEQILFLRGMYGVLVAVSIGLLALFAWFFTARAIRPVEENRHRQMQFVSAASHELRSPLAVIQTSVSAMGTAPPQQAARFAGTVDAECARMSRLIDDMLTLAGADNGSWSVQMEEADIETLLLTAMEHFEPVAGQKQISISASFPDAALPKCLCDPGRVGQVFAILLDNAVSYSPVGGRIQLSARRAYRTLKISVADNGAGIPDDLKPRIFERFFRGDAARSQKEHYGLGLCVAQEIAALHKGKLTVSDTPGGGATFCLSLPLR